MTTTLDPMADYRTYVSAVLTPGPAITPPAKPATHEHYISAIRAIVSERIVDLAERARVMAAKIVYGAGDGGYRGICYYGAWQNGHPAPVAFLEIAASAEEGWTQIAGTTIHEIAHVLSQGDGHGKAWKARAATLGLIRAEAAGQAYADEDFDPVTWARIRALPTPGDGTPTFNGRRVATGTPIVPKPCPLGIGTRGGKSRGPGSGSRLRLYECRCEKPVKVRVASDDFQAMCKRCGQDFEKKEAN